MTATAVAQSIHLPTVDPIMRRLKILHRTYYNFRSSVVLEPHRLLLRPREGPGLHVETATLEIQPAAQVRWHRDVYDNSVAIATFSSPAAQLAVISECVVQQLDETPLDFLVEDSAVHYPFTYDAESLQVLGPYLQVLPPADRDVLQAWLSQYWQPGEAVQTFVLLDRLCTGIHKSLAYQAREQPGVQSALDTISRAAGSCRDFANLFMESARLLGLAARFVSGYLNSPSADGSSGTTHAWAEVYLPGAGWKGFDPTSGEVAGGRHIAVAVARLPEVVSPVTGAYFGEAGAELAVGVWVSEL